MPSQLRRHRLTATTQEKWIETETIICKKGYLTETDGYQTETDGYRTETDGYLTETDGYQTETIDHSETIGYRQAG